MIKMYPSYNYMFGQSNKAARSYTNNASDTEKILSLLRPSLDESNIIYATYNEIKKLGNVIPLEYINVFNNRQIDKIKQSRLSICDKQVLKDDILGWIKCPSLLTIEENIYIPVQMLFIGYNNAINKGESRYIPAFSTGTASHKTFYKALENAIMEYIQHDAFMLTWYTKQKCKRVIIDDENVLSVLKKHKLFGYECPFEVIPLYISSNDLNVPNFTVILKRRDKKTPYWFMGTKADLDPVNGLLRGIIEVASAAQSAFYNATNQPSIVAEAASNCTYSNDNDKNVLYYTRPHQVIEKDQIIDELIEGEIRLSEIKSLHQQSIQQNVICLLNELKKISDYAVFMDLTSPKAKAKGWNVVRVLIPEMLEKCIPEYPFANHPRMLMHGGIKNVYPHPMP